VLTVVGVVTRTSRRYRSTIQQHRDAR